MDHFTRNFTRRNFLRGLTLGTLSFPMLKAFSEENLRFFESGAFGDELIKTPSFTEGPFYPDKMPLDVDNDLLIIGDGKKALGEITNLGGKIINEKGEPMSGATIEIWQVDQNGAYLHSETGNADKRDNNFQGFGRFETGSNGSYRFRTIKPVPYPGRTPHIHVKVKKGDTELLTTQCFVKGAQQNERDGVLRSVRDKLARESVIVPFEPMKSSMIGELTAKFDIVLGVTPAHLH
jgi:protocatechuate 3,4-dioxygenase beta subunit